MCNVNCKEDCFKCNKLTNFTYFSAPTLEKIHTKFIRFSDSQDYTFLIRKIFLNSVSRLLNILMALNVKYG